MKTKVLSCTLAALAVALASTAKAEDAKLKVGDPAPKLQVAKWVQGDPVKEFESGKKIVVTGPKDKDFKFDLDDNVGTSGSVNVGERVKVTYTKGDSGDKVTTVVPYPTATSAKTKKTKKTAA